MRGGFVKGLVMGSIAGASLGMIMKSEMGGRNSSRKRLMRCGRTMIRKYSGIIEDLVDAFR